MIYKKQKPKSIQLLPRPCGYFQTYHFFKRFYISAFRYKLFVGKVFLIIFSNTIQSQFMAKNKNVD